MNYAEKNNRQQENPSFSEPLKIDSHDSIHEKDAASFAENITRNGQIMGSQNTLSGQIKGNPNPKNGMIAPAGVKEQINSAKGSGDNLPDSVKRMMKGKSGELDDVQIHTDSKAAEVAKVLNAKAFTYGKDIFFGNGMFDEYSSEGKELIAHELAHATEPNNQHEEIIHRKVYETEEFSSDTKLLKIYNDVKQTTAYKDFINGFEGEHSIQHMRFHELPELTDANAHTKAYDANTVTIEFNAKYVKSASDIAVARTFLHELQHARLNMQVKKAGGGVGKTEFPGIHDYYSRYNEKEGMDGWQHQLMAQHQRPEVVAGLTEYDKISGNKEPRSASILVNYSDGSSAMVPYTDADFYDAMSWGGLMTKTKTEGGKKVIEKNVAWENFKKKEPKKAELYLAIIRLEQTAEGSFGTITIEG